jgi:hypothetical protein
VTPEVMQAYVGIRMIMGIDKRTRGLLVNKPFAKKNNRDFEERPTQ